MKLRKLLKLSNFRVVEVGTQGFYLWKFLNQLFLCEEYKNTIPRRTSVEAPFRKLSVCECSQEGVLSPFLWMCYWCNSKLLHCCLQLCLQDIIYATRRMDILHFTIWKKVYLLLSGVAPKQGHRLLLSFVFL